MSFYRRYRGTRDIEAAVRPVVPGPEAVQPRQPVGEVQRARAPVFPPPPTEIEAFRPTNPPAPRIPFLTEDPRVRQSLAPPASQELFPVRTDPLPPPPPVIVADSRAETKVREADRRAAEATEAAYEAARVEAAAVLDSRAEAEAQAAKARAAAVAESAERAARDAVLAQQQAQQTRQEVQASRDAPVQPPPPPPSRNYTDPTAANYVDPSVPLTAWDQVDPAEAIPLPDGTVAMVAKSKVPVVLPVAAAAGGFLVGGPIGALVGAAAGYFFSKPRRASKSIAWYHR